LDIVSEWKEHAKKRGMSLEEFMEAESQKELEARLENHMKDLVEESKEQKESDTKAMEAPADPENNDSDDDNTPSVSNSSSSDDDESSSNTGGSDSEAEAANKTKAEDDDGSEDDEEEEEDEDEAFSEILDLLDDQTTEHNNKKPQEKEGHEGNEKESDEKESEKKESEKKESKKEKESEKEKESKKEKESEKEKASEKEKESEKNDKEKDLSKVVQDQKANAAGKFANANSIFVSEAIKIVSGLFLTPSQSSTTHPHFHYFYDFALLEVDPIRSNGTSSRGSAWTGKSSHSHLRDTLFVIKSTCFGSGSRLLRTGRSS
jgi:hypothetical protein